MGDGFGRLRLRRLFIVFVTGFLGCRCAVFVVALIIAAGSSAALALLGDGAAWGAGVEFFRTGLARRALSAIVGIIVAAFEHVLGSWEHIPVMEKGVFAAADVNKCCLQGWLEVFDSGFIDGADQAVT